MQFLYLFSFAVVASTAAALPQPARPSEKYSNNADTNLASILEARCYQPVESSEENSGSDSPLRERIEAGSRKLAADINHVGDGLARLPKYADKIGDAIGVRAGGLMISLKAAVDAISSIIKKTGDVIQDAEKIGKSFADAFNTYKKYFDILKPQLEKFDAGKATSGCLKWRSRSGPVVGWTGTVEHESMGTRHDNRALGST
ncbi:hypothetical protein BASA50_003301, partial [Batrachochytrium salamandrivorans]